MDFPESVKEMERKYAKNYKLNGWESHEIFYIHSKCCGVHWKLIYTTSNNKNALVCGICGSPNQCKITDINLNSFRLDPCPCGCGNLALFSKCCGSYWELCHNKNTNHTFIQCEVCGKIPKDINITCESLKDPKCECSNPIYTRDKDGKVITIDPFDIL